VKISRKYRKLLYNALLIFLTAGLLLFTAIAEGAKDRSSEEAPDSSGFINTLSEGERAWLRDHPVISVAQDPSWPPIEFTDERGTQSGMTADYLSLVEKRLGMKFKRVKNLSWQEAYAMMKRWEIDMTTAVTVSSERETFWAFTKPYMTIPIVVVTRSDVAYIADLRELTGKKVAVVDGYVANIWISQDFPEIQLVRVKTTREALGILQRGEVFACIENMLVVDQYMAKLKMTDLKISGSSPYNNSQCMAVRKDWAILAGILDKALASISSTERNDIYRKWLPLRYEHGFNYALLWKVLAVFVVILLALVAWNLKLAREISGRRKAEVTQSVAETHFRLLFEQSPDGIVIIESETARILEFNGTAHRQLGYSHEEFARLRIPDIEAIETLEETRSRMNLVIHEGRNDFETCHRTKQGEIRNVHVTAQFTNSGDRKIYHCVWRDITERKRMEDELRAGFLKLETSRRVLLSVIEDHIRTEEENAKLEIQLRQSQKLEAIGQLAGGVAHDFNNMLSVINGYSQLLLIELEKTDPNYSRIQEINKAGKRSADLTRQLLAFASRQTIAPKVLDLNDIIAGMLKLLRRLIGENVELQWTPDDNLWKVKLDPSQVDQILANLLVNARDAIIGNGKVIIETGKVEFDEAFCRMHPDSAPGQYVVLSVGDNGCGMDEKTIEHIFEPFFTTKKIGEGTGLGLGTVFGIVKQNNGFINVFSEPGKGTTFKIYLPRHESEDAEKGEETGKLQIVTGTETVLLVEDEVALLLFARTTLERLGYAVMDADGPVKAIKLSEEYAGDIHLLMTDVVMPEMSGRELRDRITVTRPGIKCLFISGHTSDIIANKGFLDKGIHFLQKPFTVEGLSAKLRETLS
jgi:PAS domain S-box-containing protein